MQCRQTPAIMLAPGVTYFYFDHIQWTSEANPQENSTDTTLGDCSVDVTAISSFHTATKGNTYWVLCMFSCDLNSLMASYPKFRFFTLLHVLIRSTNYAEPTIHVPS